MIHQKRIDFQDFTTQRPSQFSQSPRVAPEPYKTDRYRRLTTGTYCEFESATIWGRFLYPWDKRGTSSRNCHKFSPLVAHQDKSGTNLVHTGTKEGQYYTVLCNTSSSICTRCMHASVCLSISMHVAERGVWAIDLGCLLRVCACSLHPLDR